jgi:hypothetical protein
MHISNLPLLARVAQFHQTPPVVEPRQRALPAEGALDSKLSPAASIASAPDIGGSLARLGGLKDAINAKFDQLAARAAASGRDDLLPKLEARRTGITQRLDQALQNAEAGGRRGPDALQERVDQISAHVDEYLQAVGDNLTARLTERAAAAREGGNEDLAARLEHRADQIATHLEQIAGLLGQRIGDAIYSRQGTAGEVSANGSAVSGRLDISA